MWSYAEAARAPGAPGRAWAVLARSWSGPGPVGEGSAPLRRGERTGGVYPRGPRFAFPASRLRPEAAPRGESPWLTQAPRAKPAPCIRWRFPPASRIRGSRSAGGGSTLTARRRGSVPEHDAVIELALLPFTYTLAGTVVEVLHDEAEVHRNDPGRPLPAEITHLTGLTDDDVRGERIDVEAGRARSSRAPTSSWRTPRGSTGRSSSGCSRPRARGPGRARGRKFRGLRRASRARRCTVSFAPTGSTPGTGTARSRTARRGCGSLRSGLPVSGDSVLAAMRRRALTPTVRLWAIRAPFASKEALRARGYRWMPEMRDGIERSWWTDVEPDGVESELAWLREAVYGGTWGYLPPGGIPPAARDRVRSLANGPERPGAPCARRCGRLRSGRGVGPLARPRAGDADLEGARAAARGDTDLPGGGAISQHARFSCAGSGCSPRFRGISGVRGVRAIARAAPLFCTASTRPRRPPDLPRARWLSSRSGSDTSGSI